MSNYVIIVVKRSKLPRVQQWLNNHRADSSESITLKLTQDTFIVFLSKNVAENLCIKDGFFFKGFAIDQENQSIIFGADGKKLHNDMAHNSDVDMEGCYIHCKWGEQEIVFNNDAFSICSMLYFSDPDICAVSDSMFVLSDLRRSLGLPNTPNEEVVIARSWTRAIAGQLLSHETHISQINYATICTALRVLNEERFSLVSDFKPFWRKEYSEVCNDSTYEDEIRVSIQHMSSVIQTLAQIPTHLVKFGVSGGMDSRVVLASALKSPISRNYSFFNCVKISKQHEADYNIAENLSRQFGFPLNAQYVGGKKVSEQNLIDIEDPESLWVLSNAGLYDPLYMPLELNTHGFILGGHGAELYKGDYGWRKIGTIINNIEILGLRDAFGSQLIKGISQLGIDLEDDIGSEWHSFGYANAIHSGRSAMNSMLGVRLFMQKRLFSVSRSRLNPFPRPHRARKSMVADMLIYANPLMAKSAFDSAMKNMDHNYVDERSKYLGELSEFDIKTYSLLGDPERVIHGPPNVFYHMAHGLGGRNFVKVNMSEVFECIPDACKRYYQESFNEIQKILNANSGVSLPVSFGKLIGMFALFHG